MNQEILDAIGTIVGPNNVATDQKTLAASSHDTWPLSTKESMCNIHPYQAEAVVTIDSYSQAAPILQLATTQHIPVTIRALASSVTGQPLPTSGGIVLDVHNIPAEYQANETNMTVTATASYNGGKLEDELNELGYTLGHSPQSLYRSTIGGWVSTLATGQFSSKYGGIEDLVVGYEVLLADGQEISLQASPRAAMGPDLRQVFIGAEGTLGLVTAVTLKMFPYDQPTFFESYSIPTVADGLKIMRKQAQIGLNPYLLRFYDKDEAKHAVKNYQLGSPVLFVGTKGPLADAEMKVLKEIIEENGGQALGAENCEAWMERRFDFSTVENLLEKPGGYAETIEVAHNWDGIEELYAQLKKKLEPLSDEVLVHFSHVYPQGTSMYVILLGQTKDDEAAIATLRKIWDQTMATCLEQNAELSHHHGGGMARSKYASQSLGTAHTILRKIKTALDPAGILNPGKLGLE